jgi:P-aminobenzoate N-oxygenase AurF
LTTTGSGSATGPVGSPGRVRSAESTAPSGIRTAKSGETPHPIVRRVAAIHVAEEARHISFTHEYLLKRVPNLPRWKRFFSSLYVPVITRMLGQAVVIPPKAVWREFHIPRKVRKELFFCAPESRQFLRDMFADVRMLCYDTGLMNRAARLL